MTDQNTTLFDNDVFLDDEDLENPEGLAEALIGQDKKYKSADELVKKVIHQDRHISRLERENAEFRSKVTNEKTVEALLEALQKGPSGNTGNSTVETSNEEKARTEVLRPEDIVPKVLQELENQKIKKQQEENLNLVKKTLTEAFGSQYTSKLAELAKEHDLSPTDVDTLAMKSPKLLFRTLGIDQNNVSSRSSSLWSTPPSSAIDTGKLNKGSNTGVRDNAFYEELRRKDPRKFMSDEVQAARMRDALALGDRFFQPRN